jgi:hypothetical protein
VLYVLCVLSVAGSGFSYNDYDNTNTNTNVSAHLRYNNFISADRASWQKITKSKRALVASGERDLLKAKDYEKT